MERWWFSIWEMGSPREDNGDWRHMLRVWCYAVCNALRGELGLVEEISRRKGSATAYVRAKPSVTEFQPRTPFSREKEIMVVTGAIVRISIEYEYSRC